MINAMSDLIVDNSGGCYAGYLSAGESRLAHFSSSGSNDWTDAIDSSSCYGCSAALTLGGVTGTNCGLFRFDANFEFTFGTTVNSDGTLGMYYTGAPPAPLHWSTTN